MYVDVVQKDAFYKRHDSEVLKKHAYNSIILNDQPDTIWFKSQAEIIFTDFKEIQHPPQYSSEATFTMCKSCDASNGISFKDVSKELKNLKDAKQGMPFYDMHSYYSLVSNAVIVDEASHSNPKWAYQKQIVGSEADLKALLNHPRLKGIKYKIKKL